MAGDYLQRLTGDLVDLAGDYVRSGGLRVSVKTNLGPEVPIGGAGDGRGGLGELLGIKAGVIVRDRNGEIVQTVGNPPPTDPVRVTVLVTVVGLLVAILVRGVLK